MKKLLGGALLVSTILGYNTNVHAAAPIGTCPVSIKEYIRTNGQELPINPPMNGISMYGSNIGYKDAKATVHVVDSGVSSRLILLIDEKIGPSTAVVLEEKTQNTFRYEKIPHQTKSATMSDSDASSIINNVCRSIR